jgi:hypothetical protein
MMMTENFREIAILIIFICIIIFIIASFKAGTYNQWMKYSKEEISTLKKARNDLINYKVKKIDKNKRGKLLYKGGWLFFLSNKGIRIYENCIRANFVFIRTGTFETRYFNDINKIHEVNCFFEKGDISWEELQLDTNDFKVCLIDFRYHPKEKIIAILQDRFGNQWHQLHNGIKGVSLVDLGHHHI